MGAGALVAFLLDPDRGRARRARARDQAVSLARAGREAAGRKARYARGRLRGTAHRVTHPVGSRPDDDRALADKIRSEALGPLHDRPRITVDVVNGAATLRGEVADADHRAEIVDRVRRVAGVTDVVSHLHAPGSVAPNKAAARQAAVS